MSPRLRATTAILLLTWTIHGFVPRSNAKRCHPRIPTTYSATSTVLCGGYDATIGADPNTPLQIYCSKEKSPDDLCTFLCLAELDLKYEVMSELPTPVPDWFLRIHPDGTTPALRNPVDESLNNDIVSNTPSETEKVNQYLCKVYQATNKEATTCPLLPADDEGIATMKAIQHQIGTTVLPACRLFLENKDPSQEVSYQAAAEDALRSLFESQTSPPFLTGSDLTLVDIHLFTRLKFIFLKLNTSKQYILPSNTMGGMKSWHDACASRPAFQAVLSNKEE
ncbi:MAG: hypothetical protein SGBAC_006559 [Bacillariaceae sp.]